MDEEEEDGAEEEEEEAAIFFAAAFLRAPRLVPPSNPAVHPMTIARRARNAFASRSCLSSSFSSNRAPAMEAHSLWIRCSSEVWVLLLLLIMML